MRPTTSEHLDTPLAGRRALVTGGARGIGFHCATALVGAGAGLPRLASGQAKLAFSITEPDAGTNTHNLSTQAVRDGDVYRLTGQKYYASAVDEADAVGASREVVGFGGSRRVHHVVGPSA